MSRVEQSGNRNGATVHQGYVAARLAEKEIHERMHQERDARHRAEEAEAEALRQRDRAARAEEEAMQRRDEAIAQARRADEQTGISTALPSAQAVR